VNRKSNLARLALAALTLALMITVSGMALAQTTPNLSGTVVDQSESVIVGANVALLDAGDRERAKTSTDTHGTFSLVHLDEVVQ
jgi:hypothetical protein